MTVRMVGTILLLSAAILPLAYCTEADGDWVLPPPLDALPGQLTASSRCGECHQDIYSVWRTSLHASAASNPAFLEAYDKAVRKSGQAARSLCLRCHAPASLVTGDLVLSNPLNQEGVSCDFCHSLVGYRPSGGGAPFELDVGLTKYGPVKDAHPVGHPVAYSEFHRSSEHCAGCHEFSGPSGAALLSANPNLDIKIAE